MITSNERDERELEIFAGGAECDQPGDQESGESCAAYQKIEALFDLLRSPANAHGSQTAIHVAPGTVLGEFAILRPLASGGMGHVYLARQESLGRLVALKVCKPEIARDQRMKNRFMAEALSLAQLTHPNVVPVLTSGEDQGYLYLAMEYIAGPTLAQVLEAVQGGSPDSLASEVAARILANPGEDKKGGQAGSKGHAKLDRAYQTWVAQTLQQVAQGLAAAHAAGILHRDIKPANVVFAANGVPKIVDFGLARTSRAPSATITGEFYGTPAYTSPEQARGDADEVSPASDVFSFGATLFECLSLDRPFPGRTSADVLSAVLNSDAPLLRRIEAGTPWELEAIADKCLRKSPADRYPSAESLAEDLRNYLELRPVSARPISTIGRVGRMIRRRPWVAASLFAFAMSTVAALFFAVHAWEEYKAEKTRSAKQEQELAKHAKEEFEAEKIRTIAKRVDEGDVALFRCLIGQRPTWLPAVIEKFRQDGINEYTAALNLDPDLVRPLVQRARLYASKKETLGLALADLDRAQKLQPGFGSIRKLRGDVLDELGRKDEAQAARNEAKGLYPTAADDLYWLGAIAHSKELDFHASYTYFSQALLIAPNDYWSRLERATFGRILSENGAAQSQRVMAELDIAKTIRPETPFASELLAIAKTTLDPLGSKKEWKQLIQRFGLDILRAHALAELLQKEKKYDEAETILRNVLDQDTGGVTAERIADLEFRVGHYDKACDWYRRAISEGTKHPIVFLHLANAFTSIKNWKSAEKAFLDGMAEHPNEALSSWRLGSWYEARGRFEDAERTYRKGCELPSEVEGSPRSSIQRTDLTTCYRKLALLLQRTGRSTESVQVLERGITKLETVTASTKGNQINQPHELDFEQFRSLKELLGQGYIHNGRRADAISLINAELNARPITIDRARMLANLFKQLGMKQAALDVARLAEFTISQQNPSSRSLRVARELVDGQLANMGLFEELRDRIETRRALGEELSEGAYDSLGTNVYQGTAALAILAEGTKKHPDSSLLHSAYMRLLWKAGRKAEAWKAFEKGRDAYFAQVDRSNAHELDWQTPPVPPTFVAISWYQYLLDEGKDDEFRRLEVRLKEACGKTRTEPKELMLPRAFAEFGAGRFADASKSLEFCVQEKLWNEIVSEVMIKDALTKSRNETGKRQDATKSDRLAPPDVHQQRTLTDLVEALKVPDKDVDLGRAALLLARLDNENLEPDVYLKKLDRLASEAAASLPKDADDRARLDALTTFLFKERGFHGSQLDHFDRSSCYLNKVIDDREGLPISLSVLYIELARRMKIPVVGVGLPGRFMVRYEPAKGTSQVIDVFDGGKFLTDDEVAEMVRKNTGRQLDKRLLEATPKKAIIQRMLYNLVSVAHQEKDRDGALRYLDGILSIDPDSHKDRWSRAVHRFQAGQRQGARTDVEALLRVEMTGPDLDRVRELQKLLERKD